MLVKFRDHVLTLNENHQIYFDDFDSMLLSSLEIQRLFDVSTSPSDFSVKLEKLVTFIHPSI